MWIMFAILPIAYLISRTMNTLPKKFHYIPARTGYAFILPCLIVPTLLIPLGLLNSIMLMAAALACYYIIRGISFLGLDRSYRAFGRDNRVDVPIASGIAAWALTFVEPICMAAIFVLSYFIGFPGKFDTRGMAEVMIYVNVTLVIGVGLSYVHMMVMFGNRKRLTDLKARSGGTSILLNNKSPSSKTSSSKPAEKPSIENAWNPSMKKATPPSIPQFQSKDVSKSPGKQIPKDKN